MARIRTIKPGFFMNEEIAEMPAMTRLLFIGLWTQSDREGRLFDRPKRLKAEIFPYDNYDVNKGLDDLQKKGFIIRYKADVNVSDRVSPPEQPNEQTRLIQIVNFSKHQQPNVKESPSTLPAPYKHSANTVPASQEGKGKERKGKGKDELPATSSQVIKSIDDLMTDCLADKINFVEHVMRQNKIGELQLTNAMTAFNSHLKSGGELVKQDKDYRFHFQNWLKKQDLKQFRINPQHTGSNGSVLKNIGLT